MTLYSSEIAHNRFGLGAQTGDISRTTTAPDRWLINQLAPLTYPPRPWSSAHAIDALAVFYKEKNRIKKNSRSTAVDMSSQMNARTEVKPFTNRKSITKQARQLAKDTIYHAIETRHSFQARLLDFFSNHFSVSANNLKMQALAPTLEREAIAPHLAGHFSDMLVAVETHPAMIVYLNNEQSAGPNSKFAQRKKHKGINENLAREILELHTLGVNGGYSQEDVGELAMAITGWSVGNPIKNEHHGFMFRPFLHQPGQRKVMGKTYDQKGLDQGKIILQDLSVHSSTARFISYKLARHFIADVPPKALVQAMATAWIKSSGHLKIVLTTMIEHPSCWNKTQQKFKTPREFIISACRACGKKKNLKPDIFAALMLLGQTPFDAGSPAGYGDTFKNWAGAEALMTRIEWAEHFAASIGQDPLLVAQKALGAQLSKKTQQIIRRAESRQQGLAVFLMSPEFQRR